MPAGLQKGFVLTIRTLKGSYQLHNTMLARVVRAPLAFFDRTPAGDIINIFSKDMDEREWF